MGPEPPSLAVRRESAVRDLPGAGPCVFPLTFCFSDYSRVCPRSAVSAGVTGVRSPGRGRAGAGQRAAADSCGTVSARRRRGGPRHNACRSAAFHVRNPGSCGRRRLDGVTVRIPLPVVRIVAPVGVETVIGEIAAAPSRVAALLMGATGKRQKEQQGGERLLHLSRHHRCKDILNRPLVRMIN